MATTMRVSTDGSGSVQQSLTEQVSQLDKMIEKLGDRVLLIEKIRQLQLKVQSLEQINSFLMDQRRKMLVLNSEECGIRSNL